MNRRAFLAGSTGLALGMAVPGARASEHGLAALAARSGRFFGTAIGSDDLTRNPVYRRILDTECSVWTTEWEMKWEPLYYDPANAPDFAPVDAIVAAADEAGKRVRGHTILWHEDLPAPIREMSTASDWDSFVAPHIRMVAGRYRDEIYQFDVLNEAIEPHDGERNDMRRTPFFDMLGPDYVAEAFRIAHDAAPRARLFLNDYAVEYDSAYFELRRTGVLRLLENLIVAGVPVHGFGIQGHLIAGSRFNARAFRHFLEALEDLGLEIVISELDVREGDSAGDLSIPARRQRAADEVEKVLSVALDSPSLSGVVTWEMEDGDSWLRVHRKIADNQGLPYDDTLNPTPMRQTLARLFANARTHHG